MKLFDSLQNRIILLTAASFVCIMTVSIGLSTIRLVSQNIEIVKRQQFELLGLISDNAAKEFSSASNYLSEIAVRLSMMDTSDGNTAGAHLDSVINDRITLKNNRLFSYGFFILDKKGRITAYSRSDFKTAGYDFSKADFFIKTMEVGRGIISSPIKVFSGSHPPVIIFTSPISGQGGRPAGVLCGGMILSKEFIIGEMMSYTFNGNGYLYLLNRSRELVMHPDENRIMEKVPRGKNLLLDHAVDNNFEGSGETVNSRGIDMVTGFKKIRDTDFILCANYFKKNIYSAIYADSRLFWIYSLASGIFFLFLLFVIIKKSLQPLTHFIGDLEAIGTTGVLRRVGERGNAEIIRLYKSFNDMADKLTAADEAYRAASNAKGLFLAKMSHEIRTPMNAIVGMIDLALMTMDDSERFDYLLTVKESSSHLLEIINDILDYSRVEAGAMELDNVNFHPFDVIRSITNIMSFKAMEKSLYLNLEVSGSLQNVFVSGDSHRFKQVLFNLIGNAVKFTKHGGITISAEADTGNSSPGNFPALNDGKIILTVKISDTGIGIHPDKVLNIFESFTQTSAGISREFGGSGLGLSISKEIVEMMKGSISVESTPGSGSVFTVIIPFDPADSDIDDEHPVLLISELPPVKKLKILVAEDNPVNVKLAGAVLKKLGHEFQIAGNGAEAVEILKNKNFDIVIMDIEMPVMDGIEATARIRRGEAGGDRADIPIVAMTAHSFQEMKQRSSDAGINAFISKPIKIEELNVILSAAAEKKSLINNRR